MTLKEALETKGGLHRLFRDAWGPDMYVSTTYSGTLHVHIPKYGLRNERWVPIMDDLTADDYSVSMFNGFEPENGEEPTFTITPEGK